MGQEEGLSTEMYFLKPDHDVIPKADKEDLLLNI